MSNMVGNMVMMSKKKKKQTKQVKHGEGQY